MSAALALLAMLIELCLGYPQRLTRAIGHPVIWIGGLIEQCDRHLNREMPAGLRRLMGALAVLVLFSVIGAIAFVLQNQLVRLPYGLIAVAVLASTMIAQRSLHRYVGNVASALDKDGLDADIPVQTALRDHGAGQYRDRET